MRINVRLLTALNVAHSDSERRDVIDCLADYLADGVIEPEVVDGDAVIRFRLTEAGRMAYAAQVRDNLHGLVYRKRAADSVGS
jgi:hypothetical protein